jgi:hypothetical protein
MSQSQSAVRKMADPPSSPDPLANSSESSNTLHSVARPYRRLTSPRKTPLRDDNANSQIYPSSPQRAYLTANSPSKAITEQTLSPWKIRVTVEAEPEDGEGLPQYSTQTYQVPLKTCSSPTRPNANRGRAKAGQSSPVRKRRSGTPVRGAGRRKSVTNLDIVVLGDDEDEDEWSPKKKSQIKKPGRKQSKSSETAKSQPPEPVQSVEEDEDMYGAGVGDTITLDNEPLQTIEKDVDSCARTGHDDSSQSSAAELREIDLHRVSVRPRSHSTRKPNHGSTLEGVQADAPQIHAAQHRAKGRDFSNISAMSYPTPSPTPSAPGDEASDDDDEGVGYDTVMESEGFTMIDLESIPSARRFLSSPRDSVDRNLNHEQEKALSPSSPEKDVPPPAKLSLPMPIHVTHVADETELSSNVASSPPQAASLLQVQSQRPTLQRKVTPSPYASPERPPPPPTQTKKAASPDADTLPPRRVVHAGRALYGALSSSQSDKANHYQTPTSTREEFLDGFSSGTQRELRSHLRLGEELAKKSSNETQSNNSGVGEPAHQIWRGEALVQRSQLSYDVDSRTKIIRDAIGSGSRLLGGSLLEVRDKGGSDWFATTAKEQSLPRTDSARKTVTEDKEYEKVVQSCGNERSVGSEARNDIDSDHGLLDKPAEDAEEVSQGTSTNSRRIAPVEQGLRETSAAVASVVQQRWDNRIYDGQGQVPERRAGSPNTAEIRQSQRYLKTAEQPEAHPSTRRPEGDEGDAEQGHDEFVGDETDIWLLEAQESSSSPHAEQAERYPHQPEKAQELLNKPRRKLIPSPWKRSEEITETSTMLTNADMSGMLWQQPQDTRFGAVALNKQASRASSGNFNLQRMLSSPVKLASVGRDNMRLKIRDEETVSSSSTAELSVADESSQSLSAEDGPSEVPQSEAEDSLSMPSSPPLREPLPPRLNASVQDGEDSTPPLTATSISTELTQTRPPTPRSAMKGGRGIVSPVKQVVFNQRSMYLNELGEESTMSANFDSPAPTPAQPYCAPTPAEESSEDVIEVATPKANTTSSGFFNWLVHGSNVKEVAPATTSDSPSIASSTSDCLDDESNAQWQTTRTSMPTTQPSRSPVPRQGTTKAPKSNIPKLPSYLQAPSFPSLPPTDPSYKPPPLAVSGDFTNAHFRTLHILHAKSLRPRFHAPKHVRPSVQALRGFKLTVDESAAGLDVFEWTVGLEECLVIERFMQEVEWGWVQSWCDGRAEDVLRERAREDEGKGEDGKKDVWWQAEMRKVGWGWRPEDIARHLGMVVIGECVREEERDMVRRGR